MTHHADRFPNQTAWTVILEAQDPASPERRARLERLACLYWKPVRNRGRFRTFLKKKPCDLVIDDQRKRSSLKRVIAEAPYPWPLRARAAKVLADWCR